MAEAQIAIDPREYEDEEWTMRATELAATIAWARGDIDRAAFRRWLRSEGWPSEDIDLLTVVIEHVFAMDARMPAKAGGEANHG